MEIVSYWLLVKYCTRLAENNFEVATIVIVKSEN